MGAIQQGLTLFKNRFDSSNGTLASLAVLQKVNADREALAQLIVTRLKKLARSSNHIVALQAINQLIEIVGVKQTLALGFKLAADAGGSNDPDEGAKERAERKKSIRDRYAKGRPAVRSAAAAAGEDE